MGAAFGACKGMVVLGCAVLLLRSFAPNAAVAGEGAEHSPFAALSSRIGSAPLAAHVTQWTGGLLATFASAAETRIKTLAAAPSAGG